jgi:transketolase
MASGTEVDLIVKAGERLAAEGINVRLVSIPSWEIFREQDDSYKEMLLPSEIRSRLAVEAGATQGWCEWVGDGGETLGLDRFGASAPAEKIFTEFGFTVEEVVERAKSLLRRVK